MARSTTLKVKNTTGTTIPRNSAVCLLGFDSVDQVSLIGLASNESEDTMPAIGVLREDLLNNEIGVVKISGPLAGFDTLSQAVNDYVFVGVDGAVTFENPATLNSTAVSQQIGTVSLVAEYPNGQIYFFPAEIKNRVSHAELVDVTSDQHHTKNHSDQHEAGGNDEISHSQLIGLDEDVHQQYSLVDGTRAFTGTVGGISPTHDADLTTRLYVNLEDNAIKEELDGYALVSIENVRWSELNDQTQNIRDAIDGYHTPGANNLTVLNTGGFIGNYKYINDAYTTITVDYIIGASHGRSVTVTFGSDCEVAGRVFYVFDNDGSASALNKIIFASQSGKSLVGAYSGGITVAYLSVMCICDGTKWIIN